MLSIILLNTDSGSDADTIATDEEHFVKDSHGIVARQSNKHVFMLLSLFAVGVLLCGLMWTAGTGAMDFAIGTGEEGVSPSGMALSSSSEENGRAETTDVTLTEPDGVVAVIRNVARASMKPVPPAQTRYMLAADPTLLAAEEERRLKAATPRATQTVGNFLKAFGGGDTDDDD